MFTTIERNETQLKGASSPHEKENISRNNPPDRLGRGHVKESCRIKKPSQSRLRVSPSFCAPSSPTFLPFDYISLNKHTIFCQFSFSKSCLNDCHRELGLWEIFSPWSFYEQDGILKPPSNNHISKIPVSNSTFSLSKVDRFLQNTLDQESGDLLSDYTAGWSYASQCAPPKP